MEQRGVPLGQGPSRAPSGCHGGTTHVRVVAIAPVGRDQHLKQVEEKGRVLAQPPLQKTPKTAKNAFSPKGGPLPKIAFLLKIAT